LYKGLFETTADTIAWCLMPNHFHFMIYTDERCSVKVKQGSIMIDPITNSIRKLLSGYARIINTQNNRTGSLFHQKTKSKCLSDIKALPERKNEYYINCFHYIHQNPLRANLVTNLEDWKYSSFLDYASIRNGTLCNKELARLYCDYSPQNFVSKSYELLPENIVRHLE